MNAEPRTIFEADQADGRSGTGPESSVRDRVRRRPVLELLTAGEVVDTPDHFHAAMVFRHEGSQKGLPAFARTGAASRQTPQSPHPLAGRSRARPAAGAPGPGAEVWHAVPDVGDERMPIEADSTTTAAERAQWDAHPLSGRAAADRLGQ